MTIHIPDYWLGFVSGVVSVIVFLCGLGWLSRKKAREDKQDEEGDG